VLGRGTLGFTASTISVPEGSAATITVVRTAGQFGLVGCNFTIDALTAVAGKDWSASATVGGLTFGAGVAERTVGFQALDDNRYLSITREASQSVRQSASQPVSQSASQPVS
jgi:hypothetical protein